MRQQDYHPSLIQVAVPESKARLYFRQLVSAVDYLHANGCTHNDIKPANILISPDDAPVLADFGFARLHDREESDRFLSWTSWGTPEFVQCALPLTRLLTSEGNTGTSLLSAPAACTTTKD